MQLFLRDDHQEEFVNISVFDTGGMVDLYVRIDNDKFIRLMQERPEDVDNIFIFKEDLLALRKFVFTVYLDKVSGTECLMKKLSDDVFKVVNNHACELGLFIRRDV